MQRHFQLPAFRRNLFKTPTEPTPFSEHVVPGAVGPKKRPGCRRGDPWSTRCGKHPPGSRTWPVCPGRGSAPPTRLPARPPGSADWRPPSPHSPVLRPWKKGARHPAAPTIRGVPNRRGNSRSLRPACVPTSSRACASSRTGARYRTLPVPGACGAGRRERGRPRDAASATGLTGRGLEGDVKWEGQPPSAHAYLRDRALFPRGLGWHTACRGRSSGQDTRVSRGKSALEGDLYLRRIPLAPSDTRILFLPAINNCSSPVIHEAKERPAFERWDVGTSGEWARWRLKNWPLLLGPAAAWRSRKPAVKCWWAREKLPPSWVSGQQESDRHRGGAHGYQVSHLTKVMGVLLTPQSLGWSLRLLVCLPI